MGREGRCDKCCRRQKKDETIKGSRVEGERQEEKVRGERRLGGKTTENEELEEERTNYRKRWMLQSKKKYRRDYRRRKG